jgi:hypothetical protein
MLAGRIAQTGGALFGIDKNVPNGVEYEFKRLHYEIANSANRSAMAALMNLVPSSQIMVGTDCPFVPIRPRPSPAADRGRRAARLGVALRRSPHHGAPTSHHRFYSGRS